MAELPMIAEMRDALEYDEATGIITWKTGQCAGKPAFATLSHGYQHGSFRKRWIGAHRVAWALFYGDWPKDQIDHINGIRTDNRITNLRESTQADNRKNSALYRRNSSGVNGVSWDTSLGLWHARITTGRRNIHLGYFTTKEEAAAARAEADRQHGFSKRHGKPLVERAA
jgi:hypothetical protein